MELHFTSARKPNNHCAKKTMKGNFGNGYVNLIIYIYITFVEYYVKLFPIVVRYEAKTCDTCTKKILEEKFISTTTGKFFHQNCYPT